MTKGNGESILCPGFMVLHVEVCSAPFVHSPLILGIRVNFARTTPAAVDACGSSVNVGTQCGRWTPGKVFPFCLLEYAYSRLLTVRASYFAKINRSISNSIWPATKVYKGTPDHDLQRRHGDEHANTAINFSYPDAAFAFLALCCVMLRETKYELRFSFTADELARLKKMPLARLQRKELKARKLLRKFHDERGSEFGKRVRSEGARQQRGTAPP